MGDRRSNRKLGSHKVTITHTPPSKSKVRPPREKLTPRSGVRFSGRSNFRFRGWSVGHSHFVTAQLSIAPAIIHPSLSLVVSK